MQRNADIGLFTKPSKKYEQGLTPFINWYMDFFFICVFWPSIWIKPEFLSNQ